MPITRISFSSFNLNESYALRSTLSFRASIFLFFVSLAHETSNSNPIQRSSEQGSYHVRPYEECYKISVEGTNLFANTLSIHRLFVELVVNLGKKMDCQRDLDEL